MNKIEHLPPDTSFDEFVPQTLMINTCTVERFSKIHKSTV